MKLLCKIIRKLKLSKAAFTFLSLFVPCRKLSLRTEEAFSILNEIRPDPGNSCILPEPRKNTADPELDLDIIIPCYNVEKYLHECIDSVLAQQTKYRWRIIAIDDGSADSTGAILDEYAEDCRILVKHQENRGLSGARNAGLELSDAKYVFFLDSDDMLETGALEAIIRKTEDCGSYVTGGGYKTVDLSGNELRAFFCRDNAVGSGYVWGKIFDRCIFSDLILPEGYWYEDSIMAHIIIPRIHINGLKTAACPAFVYRYRINPEGISQSGRSDPRCLDALWIHLRMFDDRQKLGIPIDQPYYEYLLRMLVLTYHRTENLSDDAKRAVFTVWSDFFDRNLSGSGTEDKYYSNLEKAVRAGDYGRYRLFCALN